MPNFLSCFPSRQSAAAQYDPLSSTSNGTSNDADNQKTLASCVFCDVSREKGFNIVYEVHNLIFCLRTDVCTMRECMAELLSFSCPIFAVQDQDLIAFHDREPRAITHLLIIPRSHVASSVRQLTREHLPLRTLQPQTQTVHQKLITNISVDSMTALAHTLVPSKPTPKLGFHIPPFFSVPHIHLHVFSGPHTFIGKFKYPVTTYAAGKGFGWFVTAEQVKSTLERGGTIGLGRC